MESTKVPSLKGIIQAGVSSALPQVEKIVSFYKESNPGLYASFLLFSGFYGYLMELNQESINEFVGYLRDHPDEFRKEITESKEFRQGFVICLQDFIKSRTQQRKEILKNIFLGFTQEENRIDFPLEQLDEIAIRISPEAVKTLALIDGEILPIKEKSIREEIKKKNIGTDRSEEWWYEQEFERESLWTYFDKWLNDKYNPNSEEVKKRYGVIDKWNTESQKEAWNIEREERRKINIVMEELVNLGILKIRLSMATFDGGSAILYDLTKLGYIFIKYIKDI